MHLITLLAGACWIKFHDYNKYCCMASKELVIPGWSYSVELFKLKTNCGFIFASYILLGNNKLSLTMLFYPTKVYSGKLY